MEKEKEYTTETEGGIMYQAMNGFVLEDAAAPGGGWTIRSAADIITALRAIPVLQTVSEGFLWEALQQAAESRKVYSDIDDLTQELLQYYI